MFKVRQAQVDALAAEIDPQLSRELLGFLRTHHPALLSGLPEAAALQRIRAAIDAARALGLTHMRSFGEYAVLDFDLGPRFAEQPGFAAAFAAVKADPDPDMRFGLLGLSVSAEDRAAARALHAPAAPAASIGGPA